MLQIFKRRPPPPPENTSDTAVTPNEESQTLAPSKDTAKTGFWNKLTSGLRKTRESFTGGLTTLVLGKKVIDDALFEELESRLLMADVGIDATQSIIADLTAKVARKELNDPAALLDNLKKELCAILQPCARPLQIPLQDSPFVILMVGINGSGKTTTIGKLAKRLQQEGKRVILAAGDTFRAAAVEQLQAWGERNQIPVILHPGKADCAAVIYDGFQEAKQGNYQVLLADTAGRLHTQHHLMAELQKVKRVLSKAEPSAPHEVLLVLDAGIGQNALVQAEQFTHAIGVTGIVVTKLDGTAKGGILFALAKKLNLPIRFIGIGEGIDDLREFNADDFVNALFSDQMSDPTSQSAPGEGSLTSEQEHDSI